MRVRVAPTLFLMALAACGNSGSGSSLTPAPQAMPIAGSPNGATVTVSGNDGSSAHVVLFAPDQVWRMLPSVFDSLGVPVGTLDPAKRTMGNSGFKVRGRLKNVPLSRFIDCGSSTQIGPNADSYEVNLTLLAEVRPGEANASNVNLVFQAVARPANFAQQYSQCASRGVLESRFIDILNARLQR
jgi:hypothetical protein